MNFKVVKNPINNCYFVVYGYDQILSINGQTIFETKNDLKYACEACRLKIKNGYIIADTDK